MTKRAGDLKTPGKRGMTGKVPKFNPTFYKKRPDQNRLKFLFDYKDGEFYRKNLPSPMSRAKIGELVKGGVCTDGYKQIHVDGVYYLMARLIWVWHNGYWPENVIDHINRNRLDNRIENLREVSLSCNARNSSLAMRNKPGVKGVFKREYNAKIIFEVNIRVENKLRHLFRGADFTEAVCHRYAAEQCLGWHSCLADSTAGQYLVAQGILKEDNS